jgi:endonuclease YncB( thermonuclease family)
MLRPRFLPAAAIIALGLVVLAIIGRAPDEIVAGTARAIDGDSLVVGGREMRLKGLDAPETRQMCEIAGRKTPCGREAAAALRRWLARGPVTCTGNEQDRYSRLLVTCRVNGQDIGADLVRNGFAVDYGGYSGEEREAAAAFRGIWAGRFERPEAWRRRMGNGRSQASP